jgi:hypothetical protein
VVIELSTLGEFPARPILGHGLSTGLGIGGGDGEVGEASRTITAPRTEETAESQARSDCRSGRMT